MNFYHYSPENTWKQQPARYHTIHMRITTFLVILMTVSLATTAFADDHVADFTGSMSDRVEISVENRGLTFAVETIKVKKGTTVELTFVNTGGFHDWVLDEFDAATDKIRAGKSDTVVFVADMAGEFEYYCSVGNHRRAGMVGTFIVVD